MWKYNGDVMGRGINLPLCIVVVDGPINSSLMGLSGCVHQKFKDI